MEKSSTPDNNNPLGSQYGPSLPPREDPNWESDNPLFMTNITDARIEDNEGLAALMELQKNTTPEERAESMKNDGNDFFKEGRKFYHNAIECYTKALEEKLDDNEKTAVYYCNRAAVHLELSNLGHVISDCDCAIKLNPKHVKAYYRAAKACLQLAKYEQCIVYCDKALELQPKSKMISKLKESAEARRETQQKTEAKKEKDRERKRKAQEALSAAIDRRSIVLGIDVYRQQGRVSSGQQHGQEMVKKTLCAVDEEQEICARWIELEDGLALAWPVLILYPEFSQSDFLEAVSELTSMSDILALILSQPTPWDSKAEYRPNTVQVYVETNACDILSEGKTNYRKQQLIAISKDSTLLQVMQTKEYVVPLLPVLHVVTKGSTFESEFLSKY